METMRISQMAERSGVAALTLRYYEDQGLLPEWPGRCAPEQAQSLLTEVFGAADAHPVPEEGPACCP